MQDGSSELEVDPEEAQEDNECFEDVDELRDLCDEGQQLVEYSHGKSRLLVSVMWVAGDTRSLGPPVKTTDGTPWASNEALWYQSPVVDFTTDVHGRSRRGGRCER